MTRIIAVAVPKGGVGKTTTTLNLGAALAEHGQRVLLIDCDPQGNLSQALDADTTGPTLYSEMHAFLETYTQSLERAIRPTRAGVDIVPTDVRLNLANGELTLAMHGEFVLQKLIRPIAPNYDVVLLDTLPYLGVLVVNTLVTAQEVIIPMEAEYFATQSVGLMNRSGRADAASRVECAPARHRRPADNGRPAHHYQPSGRRVRPA